MTPLDRAFVKAYRQRDPASIAPPEAPPTVSLGEALPSDAVGRRTMRRVVPDVNLLEAIARAPVKSKPANAVPAPHFALRRPMPEPEPVSDPQAELEPDFQAEPDRDPPAEPAQNPPVQNEAPADPALAAIEEPVAESMEEPVETQALETSVDETPAVESESPTAESGFTPGLQVEQFDWTKLCNALDSRAGDELGRLAAEIGVLTARGKAIGVCAARRGEGATTISLCLARRLARAGKRTIAIDFDLARAELGQMLGLALDSGWETVLDGHGALEEAAIESVVDRFSVLALADVPAHGAAALGRLCQSLGRLLAQHDAVLVNLAPLCDPRLIDALADPRMASRLGTLLVVYDARHSHALLDQLWRKAAAAGPYEIVLAENFSATLEPACPAAPSALES